MVPFHSHPLLPLVMLPLILSAQIESILQDKNITVSSVADEKALLIDQLCGTLETLPSHFFLLSSFFHILQKLTDGCPT